MKRVGVAFSITAVCASCVLATDFDSFTTPDAGLPDAGDGGSVDATVTDGGMDGSVVEAAADASISRFCPGDAAPRVANTMKCDVPTCLVGVQGCCIIYGNQADYCYALASEKCTATNPADPIGDFLCDDTRDCPEGQFCCADLGEKSILPRARCATSCTAAQLTLCDPADGCPGCKACTFFDNASKRYYACAP